MIQMSNTRENTYAQSEVLLLMQTHYSTAWTIYHTTTKRVHYGSVLYMQPYSKNDESAHKVKKDNKQILDANTNKTEHYKAVEHKYTTEIQAFLEWSTNGPCS